VHVEELGTSLINQLVHLRRISVFKRFCCVVKVILGASTDWTGIHWAHGGRCYLQPIHAEKVIERSAQSNPLVSKPQVKIRLA
jgi:hypothetical protein